jgi:hypothetical protein
MPEAWRDLSFNKVKVIVKCIKLVRVIKLYHDAGQQNIKLNVLFIHSEISLPSFQEHDVDPFSESVESSPLCFIVFVQDLF